MIVEQWIFNERIEYLMKKTKFKTSGLNDKQYILVK